MEKYKKCGERSEKEVLMSEPYFGWCDVKGCKNEGCSGGCAWQDTGFWITCSKHFDDYKKGKPQPKMKQRAIKRENSRDKTTGYLSNRRGYNALLGYYDNNQRPQNDE